MARVNTGHQNSSVIGTASFYKHKHRHEETELTQSKIHILSSWQLKPVFSNWQDDRVDSRLASSPRTGFLSTDTLETGAVLSDKDW